MVIKNKRGWMRILEATIAVLLVMGVLLVVYSKQSGKEENLKVYIGNLQEKILNDISLRGDLRQAVLESEEDSLSQTLVDFLAAQMPSLLGYSLKVCPLTTPPTPCKLNSTEFLATNDKDIFVEETIIASNFSDYDPKKVRLFVWESS